MNFIFRFYCKKKVKIVLYNWIEIRIRAFFLQGSDTDPDLGQLQHCSGELKKVAFYYVGYKYGFS